MSQSVALKGAECKLYIGGKLYREVQALSWTIDYGETEIYGIDSQYPQELAPTRLSVQGKVDGIRVKYTGGLQGYGIRPLINEILHAPYLSLRVKDRHTDIDILWIPQIKVSSESYSIAAKGVVKVSFTFKGIVPFNEIDIS